MDYSHTLTRDLKRRYERLESAMQTCETIEDYMQCMARLNEMGKELERRKKRDD